MNRHSHTPILDSKLAICIMKFIVMIHEFDFKKENRTCSSDGLGI